MVSWLVDVFFRLIEIMTDNQLSWNASLFTCSLIGKLCLGGPAGDSSHTLGHSVVVILAAFSA